jgi:hypothetical protein
MQQEELPEDEKNVWSPCAILAAYQLTAEVAITSKY